MDHLEADSDGLGRPDVWEPHTGANISNSFTPQYVLRTSSMYPIGDLGIVGALALWMLTSTRVAPGPHPPSRSQLPISRMNKESPVQNLLCRHQPEELISRQSEIRILSNVIPIGTLVHPLPCTQSISQISCLSPWVLAP